MVDGRYEILFKLNQYIYEKHFEDIYNKLHIVLNKFVAQSLFLEESFSDLTVRSATWLDRCNVSTKLMDYSRKIFLKSHTNNARQLVSQT